jgi:histidine triad (HIT) family protein
MDCFVASLLAMTKKQEPRMSYDPNNIFAKILRGELPCVKVYEDDHTLAFMDIMPQADGHVLVLPKAASESLLDADPAVFGPLLARACRSWRRR